jgi:DNA-binding winged helix-turn-helix (wHTH) protein
VELLGFRRPAGPELNSPHTVRVQIGEVTFDRESRQLLRGPQGVPLSPKAFRLLEALLDARPRALSKAELSEKLWPKTFVQESNLANLVSEVRHALGDDARKPRFLRTVHGFGYALSADCSAVGGGGVERGVIFRLLWGGTEIDLAEGENVFGRDRRASIWLGDASISRRHAVIKVEGLSATLQDLGSKNGTFLRGVPVIAPVPLSDGDAIAIGSVPMTFRVISTTASTVTKGDRE